MLYHYINVDGTIHTDTKKPSLEDMQKFVGGYIERTKINYNGKSCILIVNEEGHYKGLPINKKVTIDYMRTWGHYHQIVGNVIICEKEYKKHKKV